MTDNMKKAGVEVMKKELASVKELSDKELAVIVEKIHHAVQSARYEVRVAPVVDPIHGRN